jgi:hypothetical protein
MKNPRAANFVWKCKNGNYLHWFHNHGGPFMDDAEPDAPWVRPYDDRNPVWVSAGIEKDGPDGKILEWAQPELLFYDDDVYCRISYPDLIELHDGLYMSETQKNTARLHRVDAGFLKKIWGSFDGIGVDDTACILSVKNCCSCDMPVLPRFSQRAVNAPHNGMLDLRQGFTMLLTVSISGGEDVLLDNRTSSGRGLVLKLTGRGGLQLVMSDGQTKTLNDTEGGLLAPGTTHSVAVVIDGGPKIVSFIVDGKFCDGGLERQFGWSRFSPNLRSAEGRATLHISDAVKALQIFNRALMTCEICAAQKVNPVE